MPRAPRTCNMRDCPRRAVADGRCERHPKERTQPAWFKPPGTQRRSLDERTRARILRRDGHTCYQCGDTASQVDHITPVREGGTDDDNNLAAICTRCHGAKSSAEGVRARRRRKDMHAHLRP